MPPLRSLLGRSIRTLAWLGDAVFEREVRLRIASLGDLPPPRLDAIKARVVRAEAQAALLLAIEPMLAEHEAAVVRRARNARLRRSARARGDIRTYRAATALEALVAYWELSGRDGRLRLARLLGPHVQAAIAAAAGSAS
jgi:ribonuclease-3 family protein